MRKNKIRLALLINLASLITVNKVEAVHISDILDEININDDKDNTVKIISKLQIKKFNNYPSYFTPIIGAKYSRKINISDAIKSEVQMIINKAITNNSELALNMKNKYRLSDSEKRIVIDSYIGTDMPRFDMPDHYYGQFKIYAGTFIKMEHNVKDNLNLAYGVASTGFYKKTTKKKFDNSSGTYSETDKNEEVINSISAEALLEARYKISDNFLIKGYVNADISFNRGVITDISADGERNHNEGVKINTNAVKLQTQANYDLNKNITLFTGIEMDLLYSSPAYITDTYLTFGININF